MEQEMILRNTVNLFDKKIPQKVGKKKKQK